MLLKFGGVFSVKFFSICCFYSLQFLPFWSISQEQNLIESCNRESLFFICYPLLPSGVAIVSHQPVLFSTSPHPWTSSEVVLSSFLPAPNPASVVQYSHHHKKQNTSGCCARGVLLTGKLQRALWWTDYAASTQKSSWRLFLLSFYILNAHLSAVINANIGKHLLSADISYVL